MVPGSMRYVNKCSQIVLPWWMIRGHLVDWSLSASHFGCEKVCIGVYGHLDCGFLSKPSLLHCDVMHNLVLSSNLVLVISVTSDANFRKICFWSVSMYELTKHLIPIH